MNNRGMTSEIWSANRVMLHGKVDTLVGGFEVDGKPFSVFLHPTGGSAGDIVILNVRLNDDIECTPCPVVAGDWCPLAIVRIEDSTDSLLSEYDIYWGRGY